jgi:hypothetical protein
VGEPKPDARTARLAENESRFREINERLERDLADVDDGGGRRLGFVCECAQTGCREVVRLSLAEYEAVRADAMTFAVAAGHQVDDVEDVVSRHEGHWVIRKHEPSRPVVERSDPRG